MKNSILTYLLPLLATLFFACTGEKTDTEEVLTNGEETTTGVTTNPNKLLNKVQKAHKMKAYKKWDGLSYDFKLFNSKGVRLKAQYFIKPDWSALKMVTFDGYEVTSVYDTVYISPAEADDKGKGRFNLFTWPYFMLAPYKFSDDGAIVEENGEMMLLGDPYPTFKVRFQAGVGDSSDDWYIAFIDPKTNLLKAVAYIVTYGGKDAKKAGEKPHVLIYDDYIKFKKVPIATVYKLFPWSEENGVDTDNQLYTGSLSNIKIGALDATTFDIPESKRELLLD